MPLECERSSASPSTTTAAAPALSSAALIASEAQHSQQSVSPSNHLNEELNHLQVTTAATTTTTTSIMDGEMSTSQTSTTSNSSSCNGGSGRKTSITSPDPTAYVAKARVTRPTPPPPPYNPMQFVQIKPCNLYQTAQEQLKKAEEVKKIKEIRKEEPEDWQNNLDNWKSSRRKRVEHIIDRVVEVKKLELEEHDRTRRKSKTFSEMIEDRNDRVGRPALKKLASLAVYTEDESNDLSDLGIGTSSASGKSSLSEDYDNNSVMSDNAAELDKAITNSQNHQYHHHNNNNNSKTNNHHPHQSTDNTHSTTREYISSPGYETSSSTAPASTPDPCEYTYEGAIQDYKQRVSRAVAATTTVGKNSTNLPQQPSKESTPERSSAYPPRRGSKIEDRLIGFEVQSPSEECIVGEKAKVNLPKIDISKRKEIFEAQASAESKVSSSASGVPRVTLRDRFKPSVESAAENIEVAGAAKKEVRRLSGDITSIKERLQSLEQQKQNLVNGATAGGAQTKVTANKLVDVPVPPLKERLSSLQNAVTKEEVRKPPVALVDARQLEIMKSEEEKVKQQQQIQKQTPAEVLPEVKEEETGVKSSSQINEISTTTTTTTLTSIETINSNKKEITTTTTTSEVDRDDSGIHTADDIEVPDDHLKKEQELKLNAAIEALAMEEQQFAKAASAVNQIEAEFEELSLGGSVTLPPLANSSVNGSASSATTNTTTSSSSITNDHMEYSVSSTNPCTFPNPDSSSLSSSCNNPCSLDNSAVKVAGGSPCNLRRKPTNEMVHAKNLLKIFKDTFKSDIELDEDEPGRHEPETKDIPGKNLKQEAIKSQVFENQKMAASQVVSEATEVNSKLPPSGPGATRKNIQTPLSPVLSRGAIISPPSSPGGQDFKNNSHGTPSSSSSAAGRVFKTPLSPILSRGPLEGSQGNKTPLSPILSRGPLEATQGNKNPLSPILSRVAREGQREATKSPILSSRPQTPMSPLTVRSTTKFHDPDTPPQSPSSARKHDSQFSINGRVEIFNSKQMTHDNIVPAAKLNAPHSPQITTKITYLPHISVSEKNAASNIELPQGNGVMKSPITTENSAQSDGVTKSAVTTETTPHVVPSTSDDAFEDEVVALSMAEKKSLFEMKSKGQMVNEPQHNKAGHPGMAGGGGGGAGGGVKALAKSIEGNATTTIPLPKPLTTVSKPIKQQPAAAAPTAQEQQPASEVVVCAPPITIVNPDELPKPNTVKTLSSCFQPGQSSSCGGGNAKLQALGNTRTTTVIYGGEKSISPSSPLLGKDDPLLSMISSSTSTSSNTTVCTVIEANKTLSVMSNSSSDSVPVTPTMVETSAQIHGEREQRKSAEQQNLGNGVAKEEIFSTGAKESGPKDGIFSFESKDNKKDNKVEVSSLGTKEVGEKISSPESNATKKDEQKIITPPGTDQNKKEAKSGFFSAGIKEVKDKIPFLGSKETKKDDKENASSSGDKDTKKEDKKQPGITPQEAEENLALRALLKDFLETEIQFSETCEIKPLGNRVISKPLDIDEVDKATTFSSQKAREIPKIEQKTKESYTPIPDEVHKSNTFANEKVQQKEITKLATKGSQTPIPDENGKSSASQTNLAKSPESKTPVSEKSPASVTHNGKLKNTQKIENQSHESSTPIPETPEMLALKESMKDFLNTEIEYSEVVESKSPHMPFESPLQPLKVVLKDTGEVRGKVELSNPSSAEQNKKSPLTIDLSHEDHQNLISSGPSTPLSPTSQLFRTIKPLVVSTLYDKYLPEGPKSPSQTNFSEGPKSPGHNNFSQGTKSPTPEYLVEEPKTPTQSPSNKSSNSVQAPLSPLTPTSPTTNKPSEKGPTMAPSIIIPAELPNLVECPPNDSTLYKLASSAPHSPVSPRSASSFDMDSALCSNLLTSMAATADFVNFERQHTVEEDLCQKVDVEALPIDKKTPCTGFKDITNKDLKKSQNVGPKIIHKMHDAPAAPTAVDETCLKLDVHSLPHDKRQPITAYQTVSPTELKKRDNLFSSPPHSPIMEARAAHSKALIETCEKIIAEEKQVNQQLKSSLPNTPSSPKATPVLQRKSKIPKPLNTCCTATESMNEADLKNKTPANKDEAVIARMHVVETQIKVTTSTPPASPKTPASATTSTTTTTTTPSPKPQASPTVGKKAKNIFDFIKKNFGVGGANKDTEEEPATKEEKVTPKNTETYKPLESPAEPVASPSQPLVLTESDLQALDTVKYNEIHNIENSKFYLPSDDVAPPPLPKTPAPVNIEITRKIITDEIMEDGKTEVEFSSEIDALLDVELNKLNHEIEELDKVAASGVKQ